MKTKKQNELSRLMEEAGKHKYMSYLSCVFAFVSAWIGLVPFYDVWCIIKELLEVMPNFENAVHITEYGWHAVGFALLYMIVYNGGLIFSHKAAFRVAVNLRTKMMEHIIKLPLGYIEQEGSGKIRKTVFEASSAMETYLAHNLPDKFVSIATPIGLLILMFTFDWRLGIFSLIPAGLAFLLMATLRGKGMAEAMGNYQSSLEAMSSEAVEYVRGIPVVKTFGQTVFSFKRFKNAIDAYEKWVINYTKKLRLPMIIFTVATNGIFAMLIFATFIFAGDELTVDFVLNILFYVIITSVLTVTLMKLAYAGESKMVVCDALKRIDDILAVQPLLENKNGKTPQNMSVSLNDVTFSYDKSKGNAVDGISLEIGEGQHVAFVGPSGGGKTTLASLIARFWDVESGSIKIGGIDVRDIDNKKLMDLVSYVFQDSKLLKTSIFENVRMGKPNASREEVLQALKDAQCDDIIAKFPNGIDTVVGTKGIFVSGGEAQRLSVARAFLKNAPVLILDEATAFADPDNEHLMQKAFENLAKNKTVIMIAHRLSTVVDADAIYVLKNGKVAESGSHNELILQGGIYKNMWNEYNKSIEWKVGGLK